MADSAPEPLRPEMEHMIADRVAKRAIRNIAQWLIPAIAVLGFFGIREYTALKQNAAHLAELTKTMEAEANRLQDLATSLEREIKVQSVALDHVERRAVMSDDRRERLQQEWARQFADERVALLRTVDRAVGEAHRTATEIQKQTGRVLSAADFALKAEERLTQLDANYKRTLEASTLARNIAEESAVQTVGARQRRYLYGTPFDIYFAGVVGNSLRDFVLAERDGRTLQKVARQSINETIVQAIGDTTFVIAIVNTIDIPGGIFRINGSSRADAATFRINRSRTSNGAQASTGFVRE